MELEDDVSGHDVSVISDPMGLSGRVEDDGLSPGALAERVDLPLQNHDGHVMSVDVRLVAGAGRQRGGVALQVLQPGRRSLEQTAH